MTLRNILLTMMALCLIIPAVAVQANGSTVQVTGSFFSTMPTPLSLCATLTPGASGKATTFTGITPYLIKATAGPVNTNVLGDACVNANWAQNIYTVTAFTRLSVSTGVTSPPVAVSRFNPRLFCGMQGGGALHLTSFDVPPNVQHQSLPERQATYAIIDKLNPGKNFGILYYDNDNPLGPVSFVAKSYEFAIFTPIVNSPSYITVEFQGVGRAVIYGVPMIVHYFVHTDNFPGDNDFFITLTSIDGHLLYESAGPSLIDQAAERQVFDGMNVIVLCPG